jgi:hypothetical protein
VGTKARISVVAVVASLALCALAEGRAEAQGARDAAAAEALFEAGRADVARGEYASACPKFAESQRLDPAAGTLINLADCEEHLGHLARAWQTWREAMNLLPADDPRRPAVAQRAEAIDKRVPRLTLKLAQADKAGAFVRRDDVDLGAASFDTPLPVDPGVHTIVLSVVGHQPTSTTVTLAEGARETIVLTPGPADSPPRDEPPPPAPSASRGVPWLGWGLVGAGVVGIGVGSTFGVLAIDAKSDKDAACHPSNVCTPEGADAASRGRTYATVSTIGFVAGGAALAAGLYFVLTSRSSSSRSAIVPVVVDHGGGAMFARSL